MTTKERITALLDFQKVDRLPVIEWAPYWDLTVDRWRTEGLPESVQTNEEIKDFFELDKLADIWGSVRGPDCPTPSGHGKPIVHNEQEYESIRPYLYPDIETARLEEAARKQSEGAAVWYWFEAFFWHPRTLLGIEEHFYAFFDQPDLIKRMNEDLLQYLYRVVNQISDYVELQFMALADDMSYNHGPMISKSTFEEHLTPFYLQASSFIKSKGIKVFVDSDGLVDEPVEWYAEAGCQGFLPLEKQAGVDLIKYRRKFPRYLFMGGFDKLCMNKGEQAMREEFERLLPVMKQGGYIPGVDHQTPPEVSLEDYRLYISLLREYCELAAK